VCGHLASERPPHLSHRSAVILTWCCTCGCFRAVGATLECVALVTLAPRCVLTKVLLRTKCGVLDNERGVWHHAMFVQCDWCVDAARRIAVLAEVPNAHFCSHYTASVWPQ
jgi:hypothetical protein